MRSVIARMAELSSPAAVIEIGTAAPWVRKWSSLPWVRGPIWDGFWILSALWLAPIVLLLAHGYSNAESSPLDLLYFGLTALFWIGHRLSSTYLAYCTEAYRPLLREQPIRFVLLPVLITAGCFALFLPADSVLPWTREERLIGLAIIDYACVTYHFAAQHFGALSLYRSRANRGSCIQTRRWDRFFALTAGGVLVFVADILAGAVAYQDQWVDRWFPAWIVSAENGIRDGAMLTLFAITAIVLVSELRTPQWSLPRILYIVGLAVMVGLALRPRSLFLFLVIWTSQHWILATGLASQTPSAESTPTTGIVRRFLHRLNVRPWAVVLLLMLLSLVLLPVFEVEANRETGTYYGDRIFGALATQLRTSTWLPVLLALGFATGFIHYLLDRSVYRMSDPQVRAAASGLFVEATEFPGEKHANSALILRAGACLCFFRCTRKSELRRCHHSPQRRSTRRNLFTDLNGRNRDSQGKAWFWLRLINRRAKLPERECCRAPETNNSTVPLLKRIRSGVSSRGQVRRSRFRSSLRVGQNLRRLNEQLRSRQFFIRY